MYCDFYGFKEKPFTVTPNPRFVFLSKNHREAFAHLLYGIENHSGFIVLSGEIGTGKTTVLRTLLGQLDGATVRSALILNPCLSAPELLRSINREFGIEWEDLSQQELLDTLNRFLLEENRAGHTVALVIDEAQNLDPKVLEQIRLISNLETETDKLIQIVLAGQPELQVILERMDLRQFNQRVAVRYHLTPMNYQDSEAYIEHRLETAGGWRAAQFTRQAKKKIFRNSGGIPRLINLICDRSLLIGYIDGKREITGSMAARAISEIMPGNRFSPVITAIMLASLFAIIAVSLVTFAMFRNPAVTRMPIPARPVYENSSTTSTGSSSVFSSPADLQSALKELGEKPGIVEGYNALLKLWNIAPLNGLTGSPSQRAIERLGEESGLYTARIYATLQRVLEIDSPALLEIRLRNGERRYLSLTGNMNGRLAIAPPLRGQRYLEREELEKVYAGRAYLPWRNFREIPWLTPGMRGGSVARFQQLLQDAGVSSVERSGVYDRKTTAAVKSFQSAHGIAVSGRPGKQTLFFLYRYSGKFSTPRLIAKGD